MFNKIIKDDFWKNVATLLSASLVAQALPFFILPVLQKWFFTPADFGILAIYSSISLLLASVASLKYELAIVNSDSENEAQQVFTGAVSIVFIISLLTALSILLLKSEIANLLNAQDLGDFIFLIPLTILFVGLYDVLNNWNTRKKDYKNIAASKIAKSISAESTKLITGKTSIYGGLILGRIFGEFFAMVFLLVKFIKKDLKSFSKIKINEIKPSLKKHYRFPLFSMPSVFVGNLINLIFILLFTKYFGSNSVGVIGVSIVYVAAIFGIMSQAFSQVFYKELHLQKTKKELLSLYTKNAKLLSIPAFAIIIITQFIPTEFVTNLLGDQWYEMMPTLKVLVIAFGIQFISSSLSFIYIRLNKQKTMLFFDLFHLLLVWGSIIMGHYFYGTFISVVIAYTMAQVIYYLIAIIAAIFFISKLEDHV